MIAVVKETLWKQFGASIDMFNNAIAFCPDATWHTNKKFFYTAYHCFVFLDYYLTIPPNHYVAPLPFTLAAPDDIPEDAIDDIIPNRWYSKAELLNSLQASREKCRRLIAGLTEEKLAAQWVGESAIQDDLIAAHVMHYSVLEILLYNMKHVQHHTAQLNFLLRQEINNAPAWVSQASDNLY